MNRTKLDKLIDKKAEEFGRRVARELRETLRGILDEIEVEGLDEELEEAYASRLQSMTVETGPPPKRGYPKCAYPGCGENRFVRGKGFCGEHWKQWKAGEIESAEYYLEDGQ